jgi:hypothetical protein
MAASQVIDENEDIDMDSLGLSLAELLTLKLPLLLGLNKRLPVRPPLLQ